MDKEIVGKLDQFFARFKLTSYKKRESLIFLADEPSGVFYLKEGFVKMNTVLPNGDELTLNIYKPGSFFPMFWALGGAPNNYAFETMTNASLYKVSRNEVTDFLRENPDISFDLIKRILLGVDGLLTNYNHLLVGNSDTRIASAFVIAAKRFGQVNKNGEVSINLKLTHQDIANLAGVSRETASIAIGKISKEKIIKQVQRKFVILDMDKLYQKTNIESENLNNPSVL